MQEFNGDGKKENLHQWLILLIIFLSRIPFLNNGYGAEEDAWGLAVTARNIWLTGSYEASRLPGHPLQEYIHSFIWNNGAFYFNLITALLSTFSIGFFIQALKKLSVNNTLIVGIALAFTPVIYIASTNAMDYMWAMAFLMTGFYFLISGYTISAGMCIGLAVGCRITSGVFFIPFAFWLFEKENLKKSFQNILKLSVATFAVSVLLFMPVINQYGIYFFDYIEKFPDQPVSKIIYKGTIGVWGTLGFIDLITLALVFIYRKKFFTIKKVCFPEKYSKLIIFSVLSIFLNLMIYFMLPQKSAYLIPLIPFVIILIAVYFDRTVVMAFSISMIISCFTFGINLNDDFRGSAPSPASFNFRVSGQLVSLDALRGPVKADYLKRKNKMEFADMTISKIKTIKHKTIIIVGFWENDLLVKMPSPPDSVKLVYYTDEPELKEYSAEGYEILFLPEQDYYNDVCYKKTFTNSFAKPFYQ